MSDENLKSLSFEQLEEIQNRVSQAIFEKRKSRVSEAVINVLELLSTCYEDVSAWDFLNEIIRQKPFDELLKTEVNKPLEEKVLTPRSTHIDCPDLLLNDPIYFCGRLKAICNEVLQTDDSRLLWLNNDGSQTTSQLSGKELADILYQAIKKIERLCESEMEFDSHRENINYELQKISEWSEFHLGVSLFKGNLTVISPFSSRDETLKNLVRSVHSPSSPELQIPANNGRGLSPTFQSR